MRPTTVDDEAFRALAHERRRRLLVDLRRHGPQRIRPLAGITQEMAEANDRFLEEYLSGELHVEGADDQLLRTHHVHVPTLAESGYVEFDPDSHLVRKGPRFGDLEPLLAVLTGDGRDRAKDGITAPR